MIGLRTNACRDQSPSNDETSVVSSAELPRDSEVDDNLPSEEEEQQHDQSYSALLQSLQQGHHDDLRPNKRRKLSLPNGKTQGNIQTVGSAQIAAASNPARGPQNATPEEEEVASTGEDNSSKDELPVDDEESDSDVDYQRDTQVQDPFSSHFVLIDEAALKKRSMDHISEQKFPRSGHPNGIRKTVIGPVDTPSHESLLTNAGRFLKGKLKNRGSKVLDELSKHSRDVALEMLRYKDIVTATRTIQNANQLRNLMALHALNHIHKTRDSVIRNNAKHAQADEGKQPNLRDQGYTRPKVLVLLPTRQQCVRFIESIVRIAEPDQQENRSRFLESFANAEDKDWTGKPEDFQDLFGGNDDDMFRIGLKFTRKTVKFFSAFYASDIIIASPLGLRTVIEGSAANKEGKKGKFDADFLSSIEITIVDQTDALLMQNWSHVDFIFAQLNQIPKDLHGSDVLRIREWYLDGHAKHLRQNILLTAFMTPEINRLITAHFHNCFGSVRYIPPYKGTLTDLSSMSVQVTQTFSRIDPLSIAQDADSRFKYFASAILAPMLKHSKSTGGRLIFVPGYSDFVRLRNYLASALETASLSFGSISEYSSVRDVARARSFFADGRYSLLLYTERAHHFRRYFLRGVSQVVFYGVPENPLFWSEIVSLVGRTSEPIKKTSTEAGGVRAIFSNWDALKLERIVGTERIRRLLNDKGGDTFEFT